MPDTDKQSAGDWREYQRLVLAELERLSEGQKTLVRELGAMREEMVEIKVRAGFWGFLAGVLPGIAAFLLWLFKRE